MDVVKKVLHSYVDWIQLQMANLILKITHFFGMTKYIGQCLGNPTNSILGLAVQKLMVSKNTGVMTVAVEECGIQPHHVVLEVGFGPGQGLTKALEKIKDGTGCVCGLDISADMVSNAKVQFADAIAVGKLEVTQGDVSDLPYTSSHFDRIYHSNCFYFWSEPSAAAAQLLRVLKPRGLMITTLHVKSVALGAQRGFIPGHTDPQEYMKVLEQVGFENVSMRDVQEGIHAIHAFAGDKRAWDWGRIGKAAAAGGVTLVAAPYAVPAVVSAVGFTSGGIAAGSTAATAMSTAATTGVGMGAVSMLQSVGAAGIGVAGKALCAGIAAVTAAWWPRK